MLTAGMTSTTGDEGSSVEWGTPDNVFMPLHEREHFTIDLAASHENAKLPRYCTAEGTFGPDRCTCDNAPPKFMHLRPTGPDANDWHTKDCALQGLPQTFEGRTIRLLDYRDGLTFPLDGERAFLNPEWGERIGLFLSRVVDELIRCKAPTTAVIPSRTDTEWFHEYVLTRATWAPRRGRVRFIDPEGDARAARYAELKAAGADKKELDAWKPREAPPVGVIIARYR